MKERDRLNTAGNLLIEKKKAKKDKRKAKIKAKVKVKVEKKLAAFEEGLEHIQKHVKDLHDEISLFNPRNHPLQPHTKTRWVDMLLGIATQLDGLKIKKEESKKE